ncbi:MAG TPA: single-stranded DNA-binding protein [Acidimicrobiia bacterium]|jgi:single-strand DNA-binding protein
MPHPNESISDSVNIALLRGVLSSPPDCRTLPSGSELAQLQVTTRPDDGAAVSVPVSVTDPAGWVTALDAGDEVMVAGTVRRRFFRAGGSTASRVEVAAVAISRAGDRRGRARVERALREHLGALDG